MDTTDPLQAAADVIDRLHADHRAAEVAWSHDTDPATARQPPKVPTARDIAQSLADAGLLTTDLEWGVRGAVLGHPLVEGPLSREQAEGLLNGPRGAEPFVPARLVSRLRGATPWQDVPR